jgi:hypothetical protein
VTQQAMPQGSTAGYKKIRIKKAASKKDGAA